VRNIHSLRGRGRELRCDEDGRRDIALIKIARRFEVRDQTSGAKGNL